MIKDYRSPGFSESATEKRVCRRKLCKDEFLCNKTSTRVYCTDKCNAMESAIVRAEKEEAVKRIVETQKCPDCEKKGLRNSLGRNRTLIYCLNKDCDYSFIYGKRGGKSGFTVETGDDAADHDDEDEADGEGPGDDDDSGSEDSDSSLDSELESEAEGIGEDQEEEEAEEGEGRGEAEAMGEETEDPPEAPTVEELTEGCGLYTEQTPRLTDKQLAYLLAIRTEEDRSRILALAKGLHDVIHMIKSMLWQARKTSCPPPSSYWSCPAESRSDLDLRLRLPTRRARRLASGGRS